MRSFAIINFLLSLPAKAQRGEEGGEKENNKGNQSVFSTVTRPWYEPSFHKNTFLLFFFFFFFLQKMVRQFKNNISKLGSFKLLRWLANPVFIFIFSGL